jgi:chlorophyll synthase
VTTAVVPAPAAVLELLKPITWFPPMWAFGCGAVSAGVAVEGRWGLIAAGILLAGPLVCATSQIVNDWYDRHVDAINQPARPIPSGRIPGRWGLRLALAWTGLSLVVAVLLGPVVFAAAVVGLALAWAYSAPPLRLKRNGWWGNLAVGLSYESLPWFTGAAVLAGTMPRPEVVGVALLYGLGAHGIMTLNDFKAIEGDVRTGVGSLPVRLGVDGAARLACVVMAASQLAVVALLVLWGRPLHAAIVTGLLAAQGGLMVRFLARPRERATWYSGLGVTLYVLGMLTAAFALAGLDG